MSRIEERENLPDIGRLRLLEGDADRFEAALAAHSRIVEEQLSGIRADLNTTKQEVSKMVNRIVYSVLALALTIIGGIATAIVLSGFGKP